MNISSIDLERIDQRAARRSNVLAIAAITGLVALNGLVTGWDKEATEKIAARPANQSQKRVADNTSRGNKGEQTSNVAVVTFGKEQQ